MKKFAIAFYTLITLLLLLYGFYQAIYVAPTDGMQGEIQRIFYYHVPHAMISLPLLRHQPRRLHPLPRPPPLKSRRRAIS